MHVNKNVNETEWKPNLLRSFVALDKTLCLSYCSASFNCSLLSFNESNSICKHYDRWMTNQTRFIDSNGVLVYSGFTQTKFCPDGFIILKILLYFLNYIIKIKYKINKDGMNIWLKIQKNVT